MLKQRLSYAPGAVVRIHICTFQTKLSRCNKTLWKPKAEVQTAHEKKCEANDSKPHQNTQRSSNSKEHYKTMIHHQFYHHIISFIFTNTTEKWKLACLMPEERTMSINHPDPAGRHHHLNAKCMEIRWIHSFLSWNTCLSIWTCLKAWSWIENKIARI